MDQLSRNLSHGLKRSRKFRSFTRMKGYSHCYVIVAGETACDGSGFRWPRSEEAPVSPIILPMGKGHATSSRRHFEVSSLTTNGSRTLRKIPAQMPLEEAERIAMALDKVKSPSQRCRRGNPCPEEESPDSITDSTSLGRWRTWRIYVPIPAQSIRLGRRCARRPGVSCVPVGARGVCPRRLAA